MEHQEKIIKAVNAELEEWLLSGDVDYLHKAMAVIRSKIEEDGVEDLVRIKVAPGNGVRVAKAVWNKENGKDEIIKLPWKPKKGDVYFTFGLLGDKWVVRSLHWGGFPNEYGLLEKGWVYRTCAEAQSALPAVAKELGVKYRL